MSSEQTTRIAGSSEFDATLHCRDHQTRDQTQATDSTALAVLPAASVPTILAVDKEDILGKLAAKVAAHEPDVSTTKGRREIASLAAEVASSKMDLIRLGKGLTETWRKSTAAVNAECKVLEERLDTLKVQVRAPLTEFEDRERRRVAGHGAALEEMVDFASTADDPQMTVSIIEMVQHDLAVAHDRDWEEFSTRAERAYRDCLGKLDTAKATIQARDAAAAEAVRLQAERDEQTRQEAARIQAEREARIAEHAADRARQEAERRAAAEAHAVREAAEAEQHRRDAEAQATADRAQAERCRIEQEAQAAAERAEAQLLREERARRQAEESAAAAERNRLAAEEKAARDTAEAERRTEAARIAAADHARAAQAAAVRAEQERVAAVAKAEQDASDRRAADKAHRAKINRAAADALALAGITPEQAIAIVTAIARGEVPRISISY